MNQQIFPGFEESLPKPKKKSRKKQKKTNTSVHKASAGRAETGKLRIKSKVAQTELLQATCDVVDNKKAEVVVTLNNQKDQQFAESNLAEPKILTVSELSRDVRSFIEGRFGVVWIKGEISNFRAQHSGHFYFSLKDDKAQIAAVMFRGFAAQLPFKPEDGTEVIVRGKITVYEPRGSYQVVCDFMEPVGAGALQKAFEQLKAKLQKEGLFDSARKRSLPLMPRHIAVVTSPTGAAIRDILKILHRRYRAIEVTVVPAVVQGENAPPHIVRAIAMANRLIDVDVLIVARGGGSMEDLWAFNDERVARAIVASRLPVVSAIGHEIDFTIADFVADLRAPTPSAAAELVTKSSMELQEKIKSYERTINFLFRKMLLIRQEKVYSLAKRLGDPRRRLQDLWQRSDDLASRLNNAIGRRLADKRQLFLHIRSRLFGPTTQIIQWRKLLELTNSRLLREINAATAKTRTKLVQLVALMDSLSPLKVLARGYSVVKKNGLVVADADDLTKGDLVELLFAKGEATAIVDSSVHSEISAQ